jgi:hypothetical protein
MRWGNPWLVLVIFPINAVLFGVAGSSWPVLAVGVALFLAGLTYAFHFRETDALPGADRPSPRAVIGGRA